MEREALLARWSAAPTRDIAEALEKIAEASDQRVDGHGLVAWLRTLERGPALHVLSALKA